MQIVHGELRHWCDTLHVEFVQRRRLLKNIERERLTAYMKTLCQIKIAGLSVELTGDDRLRIYEPDPAYDEFFRYTRDGDAGNPDVRLSLVSDQPLPDTEKFDLLMDSGSAWMMRRDGERYYIVRSNGDERIPVRIFEMNGDFTEGSVYIRQDAITRNADHDAVFNPMRYPLDQVIWLHHLARRRGILVHCAGIAMGEGVFVFPGVSGGGKSTISRLVSGRDRFRIMSDDRIILREQDGVVHAHGTPWPGEAGIAVNESGPLSGFCFLVHGKENRIAPLSMDQALERLFRTTSIPWYDRGILPDVLAFCEHLLRTLPAYEMVFTPDERAAEMLEAWSRSLG